MNVKGLKFKKIFITLIIFNFLTFIINKISIINGVLSYIYINNEISKIRNYFILCNNFKLIEIKLFKKDIIPKISIVSPIYNRERYIMRMYKSIEYQNYKDYEIIFIDDYSKDNSIMKIEEIRKADKRVILLKNKKNKGTFISRNLGVQFSKGKYLILPDPDDILSKNVLKICYNLAEKYNYEMIRFLHYKGNRIFSNSNILKTKKKSIFQPELSLYLFYGDNELHIIDSFINNKFLKKEVYIKSLNYLNPSYLNMYIISFEDQILNSIIYKIAKSFFFLMKIGYFYSKNSMSITQNDFKISGLTTKFLFIYLKILFEYSKNNKYEKDIINVVLSLLNKTFNIDRELLFSYYFYKDIINMFLRCKYISNENHIFLKKLLNSINKKYNKKN